MPVKVVKVNKQRDNFTWYVGRTWAGLGGSDFYNPFHVGQHGSRGLVVAKFAAYWYGPKQAWLRKKALELIKDDDILGCWCHPLQCHGAIIAGYVNWKRQETRLWD